MFPAAPRVGWVDRKPGGDQRTAVIVVENAARCGALREDSCREPDHEDVIERAPSRRERLANHNAEIRGRWSDKIMIDELIEPLTKRIGRDSVDARAKLP